LTVRWARGLTFGFITMTMLGSFHSLKQSIGQVRGLPWDPALSDVDIWLHGGQPAYRWLEALMTPLFLKGIDRIYAVWGVVSFGFSVWCAWTPTALGQRARLAWMMLWVFAGTVAAWAFASGGPIMLDDPARAYHYQGLFAALDGTFGTFARQLQESFRNLYETDTIMPFGGVSAMPSMHVAGITFVTIVGWHISRWLGLALTAFAVLILIGSVVLAWHYAIDGYAGALLAWMVWAASGRLLRQEPPRASAEVRSGTPPAI
jgi:hypothetical protein